MIQDLRLRAPRQPQSIREGSTIFDKAFLDIARARPRRIAQSSDVLIVTPEIRRE
jgi:hypothetical protein